MGRSNINILHCIVFIGTINYNNIYIYIYHAIICIILSAIHHDQRNIHKKPLVLSHSYGKLAAAPPRFAPLEAAPVKAPPRQTGVRCHQDQKQHMGISPGDIMGISYMIYIYIYTCVLLYNI